MKSEGSMLILQPRNTERWGISTSPPGLHVNIRRRRALADSWASGADVSPSFPRKRSARASPVHQRTRARFAKSLNVTNSIIVSVPAPCPNQEKPGQIMEPTGKGKCLACCGVTCCELSWRSREKCSRSREDNRVRTQLPPPAPSLFNALNIPPKPVDSHPSSW